MLLSAFAVVLGSGVSAPAQTGDENPLAGLRFYVDQESSSMEQYRALQRSGQQSKADLVWRIAREPKSVWVGRFTQPELPRKGPAHLRQRARAGRGPDLHRAAGAVHALLADL